VYVAQASYDAINLSHYIYITSRQMTFQTPLHLYNIYRVQQNGNYFVTLHLHHAEWHFRLPCICTISTGCSKMVITIF